MANGDWEGVDIEIGMQFRDICKIESKGLADYGGEKPKKTALLSNLPNWGNTEVANTEREDGKVCRCVEEDNLV